MRTLLKVTVITAALATSLGLAGCSSGATASSASPAPQELRNDAAQDLAAARQATLAPLATELELLTRARQRARLTDAPAAGVDEQIAAYSSLAAAIEAAPTADSVRSLVASAGLDLDGNPVLDVG